jgi:hypothetical protein
MRGLSPQKRKSNKGAVRTHSRVLTQAGRTECYLADEQPVNSLTFISFRNANVYAELEL